jgi:hypothetical protein
MLATRINAQDDKRAAYPLESTDETYLLRVTAPFLEMSEEQLLALAPPQGGFYFSNCPNCDLGGQDNQIIWKLELGEKVQCQYCKVILPSEKYPENEQFVVQTPTGKTQVFKFHRAADGMGYWFEGRRWQEQRITLENAAYNLAQLYTLDPVKHAEAGRRAAAILNRFTQLFPDYIPRFDYPAKDKEFIEIDKIPQGYKQLPDGGFRYARWDWWAYMDVSRRLLLTYDLLRDSELLSAAEKSKIETDLFGAMLSFVTLYDDVPLTNMHPTLWISQIVASRVLDRPALAERVMAQMRQLLRDEFTYDGFWAEGTPSYHLQTVVGLKVVLEFLRPDLKGAALDDWIAGQYPDLSRALKAADSLRLPNGRYVAIRDSWAEQSYGTPIAQSSSQLWPGMGYAVLGLGKGDEQLQAHLSWSGRFGHSHYDSLNLLLFGAGRELVSDIGYTHTKARAWTMTTAAHNTVLINALNQMTGNKTDSALGSLQVFHVADPNFQVVQAQAPNAYPDLATQYQRTLIAVAPSGSTPDAAEAYVVDVFDVAGGARHDWLLHGSADDAQTLELQNAQTRQPLATQPQPSLLPDDFKFEPLTMTGNYERITNGPWALGNFRDLQSASSDDTILATFRNKAEPTRGLRSWILGAPQTTFTTARSWAVRGTGPPFTENEARLDEFLRATMMVRRDTTQSRFIALHQPFAAGSTPGAGQVQRVTQIPLAPDGFALKIERGEKTDYLLWGENDGKLRSGHDGALKFAFDGRAALAQAGAGREYSLKLLDGTRFQFGEKQLAGTRVQPARLLGVDENRYTIEGRFPVAVGGVLLLRHGDNRTTALHVARVESAGENTLIETVEPAILEGEVGGVLKMSSFPKLELPAPHWAQTSVLAATP